MDFDQGEDSLKELEFDDDLQKFNQTAILNQNTQSVKSLQIDESSSGDEEIELIQAAAVIPQISNVNYLDNMVKSWVHKLDLNNYTQVYDPSRDVLKKNEKSVCHRYLSYKTTVEETQNQYGNMAGLKVLNPT